MEIQKVKYSVATSTYPHIVLSDSESDDNCSVSYCSSASSGTRNTLINPTPPVVDDDSDEIITHFIRENTKISVTP